MPNQLRVASASGLIRKGFAVAVVEGNHGEIGVDHFLESGAEGPQKRLAVPGAGDQRPGAAVEHLETFLVAQPFLLAHIPFGDFRLQIPTLFPRLAQCQIGNVHKGDDEKGTAHKNRSRHQLQRHPPSRRQAADKEQISAEKAGHQHDHQQPLPPQFTGNLGADAQAAENRGEQQAGSNGDFDDGNELELGHAKHPGKNLKKGTINPVLSMQEWRRFRHPFPRKKP